MGEAIIAGKNVIDIELIGISHQQSIKGNYSSEYVQRKTMLQHIFIEFANFHNNHGLVWLHLYTNNKN